MTDDDQLIRRGDAVAAIRGPRDGCMCHEKTASALRALPPASPTPLDLAARELAAADFDYRNAQYAHRFAVCVVEYDAAEVGRLALEVPTQKLRLTHARIAYRAARAAEGGE